MHCNSYFTLTPKLASISVGLNLEQLKLKLSRRTADKHCFKMLSCCYFNYSFIDRGEFGEVYQGTAMDIFGPDTGPTPVAVKVWSFTYTYGSCAVECRFI